MATKIKNFQVNNLSNVPQMVDIQLADGRITSIRLMPRVRAVRLPPGAKVHSNWIGLNPGCAAVHEIK